MKILFLVQSYIPAVKQEEYLSILTDTIDSIARQPVLDGFNVNVVLCDDGSDYLADLQGDEIQEVEDKQLDVIKEKFKLKINNLFISKKSNNYQKADLFRYVIELYLSQYELFIFLDDDHSFVHENSLLKFVQHYNQGYEFIVGKLYHPVNRFRFYTDYKVQGTTFALSKQALINGHFFTKYIAQWGCGEDSEVFFKAYKLCNNKKLKAIYDSNIITIDKITGRWLYCQNQVGGVDIFKKGFKELYGVDPHNNPSRDKKKWMDFLPLENGINEKLSVFVSLSEYLTYTNKSLFVKYLWQIKWRFLFLIKMLKGILKYLYEQFIK